GENQLTANEIANLSAGSYTFTYKAVNGCGLTTAKNITFVVNQNPTISASVVTSHVCGNSGEINVSTNNGTTPYSYTINGSAVDVVDGKISNLSPNSYTIEVTDNNGCKNDVGALLINPSIALSAGSLVPISSFCANENVTPVFEFQTLPSGGSGNFTYKWTKGTESAVLGTDASYTPSLPKENGKYIPGTYTYTVTIIDQADPACGTVSLPAVVVVKPQPAVVLNASSTKSCDEDVTFTAVPSGANTGVGYQYDWNDDNEDYGNINKKTYSLSQASKLEVNLKVTVKADGCVSDTANASATIYASPTLGDFTNPADLCANIEFYNVSVALNGGYTNGDNIYTWKNGDQSYGNSMSAVIPVKNSCGDAYGYSVSVKNVESGCESAVKSGSFTTSISESIIKDAADIAPIILTGGVNCKFAVPFDDIKDAVGFQTSCGLIASNWSFKIDGVEANSATRIDSDKDVLVTVTDGCNRDVHTTVTLKAPSPLEWNGDQSIVNVDCKGNANGQIALSVTGGVTPYSYAKTSLAVDADGWQTSNVFENLSAGTYTMAARDANGCKIEKDLIVAEPVKALDAIISGSANVCKDETSPVQVVVSGGTAPYKVTVAGQTIVGESEQTDFVYNLTAGTYTADIVDANNCTFRTSSTVTIGEYESLKTALQFVNDPTSQTICEGQIKNQISVSAESYKEDALSYTWKKNDVAFDNNKSTYTPTETAVGVYNYLVSVYDGCTKKTYDINDPYIFTIKKKPTVEITVPEGSNCDGSDVVLSTVTNRVGTEDYKFKWNDTNSSTTETLTVQKSGTYTVTVSLEECSATATKTISLNSRPANPTLTVSKETSCEETIIFTASGAVSGDVYVWTNNIKGNESVIETKSPTQHIDFVSGENTQSVIGDWSVQIKDTKGCLSAIPARKTAIIYKKPTFDIVVPTDVCPNATNYPLSVNVTYAANNNYSVAWSNNVVQDNQTPSQAIMNKVADECGRTYSFNVKVTDAHCQRTESGSFTTKKSSVSDLNLTLKNDNIDLVGTNCEFKVPDVVSGSTFSSICGINNVKTITQSVASGTVITSSQTITVTATDLCGTSITKDVALNIPSNILAGKTLSANVKNVKCNGNNNGEVTLSVEGLTGSGYTYYLTNSSQNFQNNNGEFSNLPVGTYSGKIVDPNGCSLTNPNVKVSEPAPFVATIPSELSVCPGSTDGSIDVINISGGTAPYTVSVDGATASAVSNGKSTIVGLKKGEYSITVKDNNGCSVVGKLTVTEYNKPEVTITGAASVCEGNSVTLVANPNAGAEPTVIYSWVKAISAPTDDAYSVFNAGATQTVSAPSDWNGKTEYSETWFVKVKDGHGCLSDAASATATIMKSPELTLTQNGFKCEETVTFTAESATATSYSWKENDGAWSEFSTETTKTLNYVDADASTTWYVKAKNAQNCESEVKYATGYVYKKPDVSIVGDVTTLCEHGTLSGELKSNADFKTYSWKKNGSTVVGTEKSYTATAPGSYTLTVTDAHCENTTSAYVISNSTFVIESVNAVNPLCHSGLGSIEVKVKDGAADYQYVLNPESPVANAESPVAKSDANHTFTDLAAGSYTVKVIDGNGCEVAENDLTITIPTELKIDTWSVANAEVCEGTTADITLKVSGGTAPYSYKVNTDDAVAMGDGASTATISKTQGT
ncbi:MAG: SprB repeat-containing protein, partial [Paludibacteraceae bacterium]|nr:SprB repeat-containing protein [Paludibacteraceae bacterium]